MAGSFSKPWQGAALVFSRRGRLVFPTRYGYIFFAMLAALLLGSINHNNNLGFILTFLLGGIALVSVIHALRNISGIVPASVRAEPVFAGQEAIFEIMVQPVRQDRAAVSFQFPAAAATIVDLPAGSGRLVKVSCPAKNRGLLKPGGLRISTTYPLGLFRARAFFTPAASCLVYPRPLPGPLVSGRNPVNDAGEAGDAGGPGVDDFAGLETYRPGDPLQHISWKAFSRGQGLYTKKFEGIQARTLFFNPDELAGKDLEWKLSRICYMVLSAEAMQISYGLQIGSRIIEPASGASHKRRCLRELALAGHKRM